MLKKRHCQWSIFVLKYAVMTTDQLKKKATALPEKPGVYTFKSKEDETLYIGKAANLKVRLGSYLKTDDRRISTMVALSSSIKTITTDSDIEALIMESQLIKRLRPKFNIMMRDDKQYFYVAFTQETFPKIFLGESHTTQRSRKVDHSAVKKFPSTALLHYRLLPEFVGPFTDGSAIKTTLKLLRRTFPYCTCKQTHHNYCLNYHIGNCYGICCLKQQSRIFNLQFSIFKGKEYGKNIKAIKEILSGKKKSLIHSFEKKMRDLSSKQEYEKARELQYKIEKLKRVFQNAQLINKSRTFMIYHKGSAALNVPESLQKLLNLSFIPRRIEAYDIANIQGKHAVGAMIVFTDGQPDKNEYRKFKIRNSNIEIRNKSKILNSKSETFSDLGFSTSDFRSGGDTAMLYEILTRRFNHPEWPYPDLVVVDGGKAQLNTARSVLQNTRYEIQDTRVIALTKNEKHMGYKVILQNNNEILLSRLPIEVKNLLLQIDSEAHRFAISYYRNVHSRNIKG